MYPNDMTDGEYARVYGWRPDSYGQPEFDNGPDGYSMIRDNRPLFNQPVGDLWNSYQAFMDNYMNQGADEEYDRMLFIATPEQIGSREDFRNLYRGAADSATGMGAVVKTPYPVKYNIVKGPNGRYMAEGLDVSGLVDGYPTARSNFMNAWRNAFGRSPNPYEVTGRGVAEGLISEGEGGSLAMYGNNKSGLKKAQDLDLTIEKTKW